MFLILCVLSCKKESLVPAIDFNYNFYPLALSKVWVYNVDSTAYSLFKGNKNYKFKIKDTITNTFTDASNRLAYRVERYIQKQNETLWVYQKTISRTLTVRTAEELIDNKIYVRLVFPTAFGNSWNGNSKNDIIEKEFAITNVADAYLLNNLQFGSNVTSHFEEINLIREDIETHIYAQNVGLIKSNVRAVDVNENNAAIKDGFIYSMELVSYK